MKPRQGVHRVPDPGSQAASESVLHSACLETRGSKQAPERSLTCTTH